MPAEPNTRLIYGLLMFMVLCLLVCGYGMLRLKQENAATVSRSTQAMEAQQDRMTAKVEALARQLSATGQKNVDQQARLQSRGKDLAAELGELEKKLIGLMQEEARLLDTALARFDKKLAAQNEKIGEQATSLNSLKFKLEKLDFDTGFSTTKFKIYEAKVDGLEGELDRLKKRLRNENSQEKSGAGDADKKDWVEGTFEISR